MNLRIAGAVLVLLGCGGMGFSLAAAYRLEERMLRQLLSALDYMQCELQYRLTPLPELCRKVAAASSGQIRGVFYAMAEALEDQISPDVERCMGHVLSRFRQLPRITKSCLELLGESLGRFDVQGQLRTLESTRDRCRNLLAEHTRDKTSRLRNYQTLGLCAGAALAILLL